MCMLKTAKDVLQEDAGWRGSEMERRFQEGLEHLAGALPRALASPALSHDALQSSA